MYVYIMNTATTQRRKKEADEFSPIPSKHGSIVRVCV